MLKKDIPDLELRNKLYQVAVFLESLYRKLKFYALSFFVICLFAYPVFADILK